MGLFSHPSHNDTTGDYAAALEGIIDEPNQLPKELGPTSPAPAAVSHGFFQKFCPELEKFSRSSLKLKILTFLCSRFFRLAVSHHVGNYVATTRGPDPTKVFESMPIYVRLGMHLLYVGKEQEKLLGSTRVNEMLKAQSVKQGKAYDSTINVLPHIENFVKTYAIDTSTLLNPDLKSYSTFNEFFYRKLKADARPIAEPENGLCISSAADSRLTVFSSIEKAKEFWIKGKGFTVSALLQDEELAKKFEGGELAIFRLAPADYHRWHTPVDALVGTTKSIEGDYYTVNPSAINEDLDVFTKNHRDITLLTIPSSTTGSDPIEVVLVSVGAMLVGSICHTAQPGQTVRRGEELGYFKYGGSTCIALFPPGRVQWDSDLLTNSESKEPIETAVRVGDRIGTFI